MYRTLLLLLAAVMLVGVTALAAAEEPFSSYASDFSQGEDGWYPRSAGEATLCLTDDGALRIEGRTATWNSPGRDFALVAGQTYEFSVQVRQDEVASAGFMVSVAHSKDGAESYENLATVNAAKGQWTELKGTYTPSPFDRYVLYVETKGDGTISFDIKDFRIKDTSAVIDESAELPSLKEVYADHFVFGAAFNKMETYNAARMRFYAGQFAIMTPGNELKPDFTIDLGASKRASAEDQTAVAVTFNSAKPMLDWAWANGVKIHGHVFVWHSQTPENFFHENYDNTKPFVSREVMLARLENYMKAVFSWLEENYPGLVVSYDVANECIDDGNGSLRKSNWLTVVGDDYVNRAFEIARKVAPEGVKLYYNDYNTAVTVKLAGIRRLLLSLQEEGNIDGYGFQMHHSVGSPSLFSLKHAVETIAATGLRMRVSELDVGIPSPTEENLLKQAEYYRGVMDLLLPYAEQIDAVQVWGVTDDLSWRAASYPLLFDKNIQPKYAFCAVTDPSKLPQK